MVTDDANFARKWNPWTRPRLPVKTSFGRAPLPNSGTGFKYYVHEDSSPPL